MTDPELIKITIEEFSRLQRWMLMIELPQDSKLYQSMYKRYVELKIILSSLEINLTELDMITK